MNRVVCLAGVLAIVAVTATGGAPPAAAQSGGERITNYEVVVDVARSGRIEVQETIDYDFGGLSRHGIYRTIPVRFRYDDTYDRVYPIGGVRVTGSPGTPTQTKVETQGRNKVIRIGDPDRTITGAHRYVISYHVDGALNRFESHDELFWNAIGTEWAVPIQRASVVVEAEDRITKVACFAGPQGSSLECDSATADGTRAIFGQARLGAYSGVSVVVALPAGYAARPGPVLTERWRFEKAFSRGPRELAAAGVLLLAGVGAVGSVAWRTGRDRRFAGEIPGLEPPPGAAVNETQAPLFADRAGPIEYAPPEGMRPALMGVLIDETADPLDVTATIVDLAVRRHLRIEELPREGLFRRRDWRLSRVDPPPDDQLDPWERTLLNALFEDGPQVELSDLKNEFHTHLKTVQDRLYDEAVRRGWFTRRPDKERGKWFALGVAAVLAGGMATYVLARWTTYGLAGVALVVAGLVLLALHRSMPSRTGRGSAALARALGFRRYLATAEANQLRFEEQEGVFARYLPYAVVLGETKRWAKAFEGLGARQQQELYWYSGPAGWTFSDFGDSMSDFSVATSGTIASTPSSSGSSGFSGGGFSGGGGGGGGGGSW